MHRWKDSQTNKKKDTQIEVHILQNFRQRADRQMEGHTIIDRRADRQIEGHKSIDRWKDIKL
jgi:hypothetical protein